MFAYYSEAQNWQFNDMRITSDNNILQLTAHSITTPFVTGGISNIKYQCQESTQIYPLHSCGSGQLSFDYTGTSYDFLISGWFNLVENTWDLNISNHNKSLNLIARSETKEKLSIKVEKIPISELSEFTNEYFNLSMDETNAKLTANIDIDLSNEIVLTIDYLIDKLTWESQDSEYIFSESQLQGEIKLNQTSADFDLEVTTQIDKGEGLFKDIYVLFDEYPVVVTTFIKLTSNFEVSQMKFKITSTDEVQINVDLLDLDDPVFAISYDVSNLNTLYKGFLASYLEIIGINDLETIGTSKGELMIKNGEILSLQVALNDMYLVIESKKIEIDGLYADLHWEKNGEYQTSTLKWQNLLLAGMPINQSQLEFSAVGQQLKLRANTTIPIFDGSVMVNRLSLKDLLEPQIAIDLEGEVQPISIALITEKMGWPLMNGTISGKIPGMKKLGSSITFDGSLDLQIFDGQMKINNLSMERLFGIAPVIAADIKFTHLNLQQITSTFDFGEITGLIEGYVNGLRVTNWKADRLDAHIHSINTKKIKQTISQRAIDNISSIGGIQGALSRSFLRFFDYFKYKKIGVGCKLRNSICEMSGIDTVNNNYTLIKGKGIPSINIIGFRKFIDWEVFMDRLLNAGY